MNIKASNQITLLTGVNGNGISSITAYYQVSTSNSTAPTSWLTTVPTMTATNKYLWNYEVITYTDGSTESTSKRVIGAYGDTGATGNGIKTSEVTYQASTSGTTIPTGTWSTSIPSVAAGSYLWTKTVVTYTDGTTTASYSVGKAGKDGTDGRGIKSTAVTYQAGASGTTVPTGTWTTDVPATSAANPYLWSRTIITYTDGTTTTTYAIGGTIEGVQVGGRNLIAGTSLDQVYSGIVSSGKTYNDIWSAVTINPVTGSEYVVSFEAKADEAMTISCYFYNPATTTSGLSSTGQSSTSTDGSCTVSIGTEWKRYWVKWTQSATSTKKHVIVGRNFSSDITAYIRAVKLEEGNIPTDWTPAPEDVNASIEDVNVRTINNTASIVNLDTQISLRATTEELNSAVSEQNTKTEAAIKVASDAIKMEAVSAVEQKIKDGDEALAAKYEEIRTYLNFSTDGLYLGKTGNDTIMHIINNAMEILIAGVAATTVDETGLTATQANIRTLHMGNFTLSVSESGNTLSLT